ELVADLLRSRDSEAVRLVGRYAAPRSQQAADLVVRGHLHPRTSHGNDDPLIIHRVAFEVGAERNNHFHVAGSVQCTFLLGKDADDRIKVTVHEQLLAHSIFVRKETLFRVKAHYHDVSAVQVFLLGEKSSRLQASVDGICVSSSSTTKYDLHQ